MRRESKSFATAINCIDGRVQMPTFTYLQKRFSLRFVDAVTEPAPVIILSERQDEGLVESILRRVDISVERHGSKGIGIAAHYGCAVNLASKEEQIEQLKRSARFIARKYPKLKVVGIWLDEDWLVSEVCAIRPK